MWGQSLFFEAKWGSATKKKLGKQCIIKTNEDSDLVGYNVTRFAYTYRRFGESYRFHLEYTGIKHFQNAGGRYLYTHLLRVIHQNTDLFNAATGSLNLANSQVMKSVCCSRPNSKNTNNPSSRVQTRPKSLDFSVIWKILRMPSFGGEVKESVPCPSFAARKRT